MDGSVRRWLLNPIDLQRSPVAATKLHHRPSIGGHAYNIRILGARDSCELFSIKRFLAHHSALANPWLPAHCIASP